MAFRRDAGLTFIHSQFDTKSQQGRPIYDVNDLAPGSAWFGAACDPGRRRRAVAAGRLDRRQPVHCLRPAGAAVRLCGEGPRRRSTRSRPTSPTRRALPRTGRRQRRSTWARRGRSSVRSRRRRQTISSGSAPVGTYHESQDVHVYVNKDGWIMGYYLAGDPAGKAFDWMTYHDSGRTNVTTKLETAMEGVLLAAEILSLGTPTYLRLSISQRR